MNSKIFRTVTALAVIAAVAAFYLFHFDKYFTLQELKARQAELQNAFNANPFQFAAIFAAIYVVATALSIPGATVLTLAAGFIFGFGRGLVLVSLSSTLGATLAFLLSRFFFSDFVTRKFGERIRKINAGIEKEGSFYLLTLRLIPIFPFFLVNLTLGLTPMRTLTFAIVSLVGMLPGTAAYVNAGTQLSQIQSLSGLLSPGILLSFTAIGLLPLIAKYLIRFFKGRKVLRRFKKPKSFDYNMVVIGAGSGGLVSAYIAAAVKAKVAIIEKHKMGGDCLNTGCVPSKALIRSAKIANDLKRAADFGFDVKNFNTDFAKVMERVQSIIKKIEPHDSVERYQKMGVDCLQGSAKILTPFEVQVADKILTTKSIVIATGAGPLIPPIPGLKEIDFLTSDTLWNLRKRPDRFLVLGGGPIGCELAQAFSRLGSKVFLVEMGPRILSREDEDVSEFVKNTFVNEGVQVLTSHKALSFATDSNGKFLICENNGKQVRVDFDQVLIALGRKPNTTGFGLEELGIEISKKGTIAVSDLLQTNFPNIFACGDVAGPYQFTHTAAHQAWYASVNALFSPFKQFTADYRVIPWCTFTDPEIARVGLSEAEANEQKIPFEVSRYEISDLDRAITEGAAHGFVKVLTMPGKDKILGVTIVGEHAGDIIAEYVSAMKHGIGLKKILGTIHIYPTLTEANKFVAGVWQRNHVPKFAMRVLEMFHSWRR